MSQDTKVVPLAVCEEVESALSLAAMELARVGKHADADIIMHAVESLRASKPAIEARLRDALSELHAMVWGESPGLLNEDSGGSGRLDLEIRELLAEKP